VAAGPHTFLLERPCANSYYRVLLHQLRVVEHEFLETVKLSGSDGVGISQPDAEQVEKLALLPGYGDRAS
jgi:hypothetical protein